jgi:hypothetical protein
VGCIKQQLGEINSHRICDLSKYLYVIDNITGLAKFLWAKYTGELPGGDQIKLSVLHLLG